MKSINNIEFNEVLDEQQQYILYKTYYRYVLKCIYNITKDEELSREIVNETFLVGFDKYSDLNDKSKFKTWICTIGINLAKKHLNKYKNIHLVDDMAIFDEGVQSAEDEFFQSLNKKISNKKVLIYGDNLNKSSILRVFEEIQIKTLKKYFGTENLDDINEDRLLLNLEEVFVDMLDLKENLFSDMSYVFYINKSGLGEVLSKLKKFNINIDEYIGHAHPYCSIRNVDFEGYCYNLLDGTNILFYMECDDEVLNKEIKNKLIASDEEYKYLKIYSKNIEWDNLLKKFKYWIKDIMKS